MQTKAYVILYTKSKIYICPMVRHNNRRAQQIRNQLTHYNLVEYNNSGYAAECNKECQSCKNLLSFTGSCIGYVIKRIR